MALAQSTRSRLRNALARFAHRRMQEGLGILILLSSCIWLLALISYSPYDTTPNQISETPIQNWLGPMGAYVADISLQVFGGGVWAVLPGMFALGTRRMLVRAPHAYWRRLCAWACAAPLLALALAFLPHNPANARALMTQSVQPGGAIGQALARPIQAQWIATGDTPNQPQPYLQYAIGFGLGAVAVWLALYAAGWLRPAWVVMRFGGWQLRRGFYWAGREIFGFMRSPHSKPAPTRKPPRPRIAKAPSPAPAKPRATDTGTEHPTPARQIARAQADFVLPPVSQLKRPAATGTRADDTELQGNAAQLESVLAEFSIDGRVLKVRAGPVVTLYEFEPAAGIRTARIVGLADDIARSMKATSCRVAVVPGQNVIGIELPNDTREMVSLRELLSSQEFQNGSGMLSLALGKNIAGAPFIADLMQMPHLLVAGTTGAGKSVGINTMILSLLYRLTPEQCRLILVDPKILELSIYEGIPHLLAPVVTEPKKAVFALKWAIREMEQRYRQMSALGVRNIQEYNAHMAKARAKGTPVLIDAPVSEADGSTRMAQTELPLTDLPFIVIVIDEMADLMAVAGKDIEGAVQRLAQMARAAGLHLIMATQRPSVDVITGTIKANFPSRISFQVTSKIDSRTILGEHGGEQLLGKGDMLVMSGGGRIQRVHGAFVSEEEVKRVVDFLKKQREADYTIADAITRPPDEEAQGDASSAGGADPLYAQAVDAVLSDNRPSISFVQRRLQIGYNRAARLIEEMEKNGIISSANAAGKRDILER